MGRGARSVIAIGAATSLAFAAPVSATPPGTNGPIVWQSQTGTSGGLNEIWIMQADGSGKLELTDNAFNDERPVISADGSKVAFQSFRAGDGETDSWEIYVMNAAGGAATPLTDDGAHDFEPAFSPDGSKVIYTADGNDLWTVPTAGGTPVNVTNTPLAFECCAEYSPDGTKIAYVLNGQPSGNPADPYDPSNIWVANANGTNPVNLTDDVGLGPANLGPTWSPDGERIAYAGSDAGDYEITVMDSDGTDALPLTNDSVNEINPVFSPDGASIAFTFPSADNEIVTIPDEPTATANFGFLTENEIADDYASWAPAGSGSQAPETTITKRPADVISKPKATFEFTASPAAGASFQCSLDGKPFKGCSSPKTYRRLDNGRHRFKVRARNSAGADPTPAKDKFKVRR